MGGNLNRRDFMGLLGGSVAGIMFGAGKARCESAERPNFVLIFADDLGYGDIGGFGVEESLSRRAGPATSRQVKTPNLDRMASEGAKLTSFYVPTPYCAPSRGTILTGRYPFRHGVVFNPAPDAGVNDVGLPHSEITIAEALGQAGYASICIGKWHLGHTLEYLPRKQGFDEYFGILYSNDMRPVQLVENEKVVEYPVVQATLTKRYTQRALEFIDRSAGQNRPFFVYLAHAMPHKPLAASEDFYTPDTPQDLYADVIAELDWSVGQILEKLKSLNLDGNTMVVFTSDNGPWYGGGTGGLRGMKGKTWEGGLRVPMIARWPGSIPAGVVNNSPAGTIDILPTILKAASVPIPSDRIIDGKDIMPMLESGNAQSPHDAIFAMQGPNLATIRSGNWKLNVRSPGPTPNRDGDGDWVDPRGPDGVTILAPYEQARPSEYPGVAGGDKPKTMMLFDIESDPAEQHDLSDKHPEIVKRLKAAFDKTLADVPEFKQPRSFDQLKRPKGGSLEYGE